MDIKIVELINELIDELDKSTVIKQINILKQEIYSDQNLNKLLIQYKNIQSNPYSEELIDIKHKIINDEKVKEFRNLQYQLNDVISDINERLIKLTKEKSCIL